MLSNNLLQARLPMQCICVSSSEAATVNENLHSLCSAAKCGWVYRHGFCTDPAHLPNAPWLVRRTGRVFGRSCPALLLFGAFHPRLHRRFFGPGALSPVRRATWKQLLSSTHGPLLCISSCSVVKVHLLGGVPSLWPYNNMVLLEIHGKKVARIFIHNNKKRCRSVLRQRWDNR